MAAPFVVACTHCGSKLKLKDASAAGKKLKCPKCQEIFVVPGEKAAAGKAAAKKPAKPKDEFDFANISEDDYEPPPPPEGEEGEEQPELDPLPQSPLMKKKASGKPGARKKKRASSGPGFGKIAIIGALILVGVGLVGGVGYGLYLIISGLGGGAGRFAWLPDDSEMAIEVRVAKVWSAPALQPIINGPLGAQLSEQLKSETPLNLADIDRVVVGGAIGASKPVIVMYTKTPIDQAKSTEGATTSDYGGFKLYSKPQYGTAFFPDATTMVIGPDDKLKAAIDHQGVCAASDRLSPLPTADIAFYTTRFENPSGQLPAAFTAASFDPNQLTALAVGVDIASDISLEVSGTCRDAATATKLAEEMQRDRENGLSQLKVQKEQLVPNPFIDVEKARSMLDSVESALQSYQVSSSGTSITGSLKLPGKIITDASEMIAMMGPMMQGLGGGMPAPTITPMSESSPGETPPASEHSEAP